jgi:hypothetical protein
MIAVSRKVLLRFFPPVCPFAPHPYFQNVKRVKRNVFQPSPQYDIDDWEWKNNLKMAPVCQLLLSFVCCMCTGLVTVQHCCQMWYYEKGLVASHNWFLEPSKSVFYISSIIFSVDQIPRCWQDREVSPKLSATLDEGPRSRDQWIQEILLVKSFKLVPRPLDKGPRPKNGKLRLKLHDTCFGGKINWFQLFFVVGDFIAKLRSVTVTLWK